MQEERAIAGSYESRLQNSGLGLQEAHAGLAGLHSALGLCRYPLLQRAALHCLTVLAEGSY